MHTDSWLLNVQFDSVVQNWSKTPDSDHHAKQMETLLGLSEGAELTVKIRKDVLDDYSKGGPPITKRVADQYSETVGDDLVFKTGRELSVRVARIKEERYLVLESVRRERFYFSPQDITSMSVK
jgi:hypothetical protein